MSIWLGLDRLGLLLLRKLLSAWTKTVILPEDIGSLDIDSDTPVCYVLELRSLSNLLMVEQACRNAGLPGPRAKLYGPSLGEQHSVFSLSALKHTPFTRDSARHAPPRLERIVNATIDESRLDVQLVPVSVFWGRAPDRERSGLIKALFSDSWARTGRLRKFFTILLHGRDTFVQFGKPVSVRELIQETQDDSRVLRKLYRVLRTYFRRTRIAAVGPDLSHRRTLIDTLLSTTAVRVAIENEAREENQPVEKAREKARKYAYEIAANYSYPLLPVMDRLLTRLWNRLYDGVVVNHIETVREIAAGNGIVYLPCHRSHIDYLLLSYVLYRNGFAPPHIAAGINLNLPVVGPILRAGGAFFIRRSFQGKRLYATVFHEYLCANMSRGFPLEYFIEGGRSRTGRSLKPKPGMLAMTVRSALRYPERNVVFVPVYIGYEKLVEGSTYVAELSGKAKRKESIGSLLRSLRDLRSEFGKVYVNFGEPIALGDMLDNAHSGWRDEDTSGDHRPEWLPPVVNKLSRRAVTGINNAVAVNAVNLLGLALLSTPRQALAEATLTALLDTYSGLLRAAPYSDRMTVTSLDGKDIIAHGEKLGLIERQAHPLGDLISARGNNAVLLTYFRNNILHLFALPSLVARCFSNNRHINIDKIRGLVRLAYPYIRSELFLRWEDSELDTAIDNIVEALASHKLLRGHPETGALARPDITSARAIQLSILGNGILPNLERYYLTMALLRRQDAATMTQEELENMCHLVAQRMSVLQGFNSPEFFDKTLFSNFIETLAARQCLDIDETNGLLTLDESVDANNEDVNLLLSQELRHSILQITRV